MAGNILLKFFNKVKKLYGLNLPNVFIETGTGYAETTELASGIFRKVHTIELSEVLYKRATDKFGKTKNVTCHFGDSKKILPKLIAQLDEPIIFYLDAHYSGGLAAFGEEEVPLLEELKVIKTREYPDIIIIDDLRLFGKAYTTTETGGQNEQYPPISWDWRRINRRACREKLNKNMIEDEFVYDDRLIFFMKNPEIFGVRLIVRKQRIALSRFSKFLERLWVASFNLMLSAIRGFVKLVKGFL